MSERYKAQYLFNSPYGQVALTCHFKFEKATADQKFDEKLGGGKPICNGCGPSGYGQLIPDSILGVLVTICGHIHNFGYQFGTDHEDKFVVDETFGDNMDRLIRAAHVFEMQAEQDTHDNNVRKIAGGSLVSIRTWLEHRRNFAAKTKINALYDARLAIADNVYENAVKVFGKSCFWDKRQVGFTLDEIN